MNYEAFKKNSSKEFLGYCDYLKAYIYSIQLDIGKYAVVALRDAKITVLITYTVQSSLVRN